jgi:hypothetical protein
MKCFAAALLLVSVMPFAGCNQNPDKPAVDIHTPGGVDVKSDKGETTVHTPGADVDVNKK